MNKKDLDQISSLLDEKINPIKSELTDHGDILKQQGDILKQQGSILNQHSKILNQHSKTLKSLKKDQNMMLRMLDGEQMRQRKRIKRVEEHLDLSPLLS